MKTISKCKQNLDIDCVNCGSVSLIINRKINIYRVSWVDDSYGTRYFYGKWGVCLQKIILHRWRRIVFASINFHVMGVESWVSSIKPGPILSGNSTELIFIQDAQRWQYGSVELRLSIGLCNKAPLTFTTKPHLTVIFHKIVYSFQYTMDKLSIWSKMRFFEYGCAVVVKCYISEMKRLLYSQKAVYAAAKWRCSSNNARTGGFLPIPENTSRRTFNDVEDNVEP